ncbi:MAG: phenylacetate--CoA ligase family protein [Gammaproteobacteria bacterium]|nr:phenylacetate--CoA ligase family protein [Gammaproteobacteria bacterium]
MSEELLPGIMWPEIPANAPAPAITYLQQLKESQWWSRTKLDEHQFNQVNAVYRHAFHTIPFYQKRFLEAGFTADSDFEPDTWRGLPLLTRRDVQMAGESLFSNAIPPSHLPLQRLQTSGSTGEPVVVNNTRIGQAVWRAMTVRDHVWHGREFSRKFASVRHLDDNQAPPPNGATADSWGAGAGSLVKTGPGAVLNVTATVGEQVAWIMQQRPGYLLSYPTNIQALAERFIRNSQVAPGLQQIITMGEILTPSVRKAVQDAWGIEVKDTYSSQEVGYMALQCPDHHTYHVQSEAVLIEVLNDAGEACAPGEIGRVVVTNLMNLASPLIRYECGDYAEVGEACPCGRGLPVLKRIMGRQRNMLIFPNGEKRWPVGGDAAELEKMPAINQFQIVQKTLQDLEVRLVAPGNLTSTDEQQVTAMLHRSLGHPFNITYSYYDQIPRSKGGKYEDFRCEVESPT